MTSGSITHSNGALQLWNTITASISGTATIIGWIATQDNSIIFVYGSPTIADNSIYRFGTSQAYHTTEYEDKFRNTWTLNTNRFVITTPPEITTNPQSQCVTAGQNANFTAAASGTPTPSIQWQVSTDGGASWSNISGANTATLTLTNVTVGMNNNRYRAVATHTVGSQLVTTTSNAATLTVVQHTGTILKVKVSGSGGFRDSEGNTYRNSPNGIEGCYSAGAVVLEFIPDAGSVIRRITRSDVGNIGPNLEREGDVRKYQFNITEDTVIEVHFGAPHPGLTIKGDLIIHSGTAIFETKEY